MEIVKVCNGPLCKGKNQPLHKFYKSKKNKDGLQYWCKECANYYKRLYRKKQYVKEKEKEYNNKLEVKEKRKAYKKRYRNKSETKIKVKEYYVKNKKYLNKKQNERLYRLNIHKPASENIECSSYLGVFIAENVLSKVFKDVKRMPNNNPGFDFICNKGYKIDVKSSVLSKSDKEHKNLRWSFSIKKNKIADYFLCIGFDNRRDLNPLKLWLIPGKELNNQRGKYITNTKKALLKWKQYEINDKLEKVIMCCNRYDN